MMGMPGENDRSVTMLKSFMRQTKPEGWTLATLTPYPGCDMWNDSEKYEIKIINKDFSNYWNFCEESYNHVLHGQTKDQMWKRYGEVYSWLTSKAYLK